MTRYNRFLILSAVGVAMLWPSQLLAQRAVPRHAGGTVVVAAPRFYSPFFYSSFYYPWYGGFYSPFYAPFYPGFYGFYGYPYGYPYYYGPWAYDNTGSARIQVTPRHAQVYVDGYFAGTVDDFDGTFQRLNVVSGEHELQLYLQGYRPFSQKVLFVRGRTLKIMHTMEPLAPGEAPAEPPKPDESRRSQPSYRGTEGPRMGPPPGTGERSAFGSVLLRVRPADATILVDGEVWTASQGEEQFTIELAEGPHRVEVRKDGFQTYSTTVRVRRGETVRVNVSLTSGSMVSGF